MRNTTPQRHIRFAKRQAPHLLSLNHTHTHTAPFSTPRMVLRPAAAARQLTEKQKQRLKNAGLLEKDIIENTELVVQILRANEGLDVEALRTFELFRKVDRMTLTRSTSALYFTPPPTACLTRTHSCTPS